MRRAFTPLRVIVLALTAQLASGRTLSDLGVQRRRELAPGRAGEVAKRRSELVAAAADGAKASGPALLQLAELHETIRRFLKTHLQRISPGVWLVLSALFAADSSAREEKQRDVAALREQMLTGDYHIAIVTTAALPWMTGTAVNPLLRAAYLAKAGRRVTLCVPWLHPLEQAIVFKSADGTFDTPAAQEAHIRGWLEKRGGVSRRDVARLKLAFYPARYDRDRGSILPLGDTTRCFGADESDVVVLEEPEHLNWYHHGHNWRRRFKYVVGIAHTNYIAYAEMYEPQLVAAIRLINKGVCAAYCDSVIKLSDTLQPLPRSVVCNVHGVRAEFLEVGRAATRPLHRWRRGAYFIGKVLWAKGHRLLIDYLSKQAEFGQDPTRVDVYGGGEDLAEVKAAASAAELELHFHKATDHADPQLREYKVFVNPSQTEVLSTTTAEALAMGKFVVIQRHPSNAFFMDFANTLAYDTPEQFLAALGRALSSTPAPLSEAERRKLSWEGATERFLHTLDNATSCAGLPSFGDRVSWFAHSSLAGAPGYLGDAMRTVSGGGPVSRQSWSEAERFRRADVTELVERSVAVQPPHTAAEWSRAAS